MICHARGAAAALGTPGRKQFEGDLPVTQTCAALFEDSLFAHGKGTFPGLRSAAISAHVLSIYGPPNTRQVKYPLGNRGAGSGKIRFAVWRARSAAGRHIYPLRMNPATVQEDHCQCDAAKRSCGDGEKSEEAGKACETVDPLVEGVEQTVIEGHGESLRK